MAVGQIIGRVSVKCVPDTSDFRRIAQRDLDRIEDQLSVKVHLKIDLTQLRRDLLQGIRDINKENRELESRKIRVLTRLKADRAAFREVVREYQRMASAPGSRVTIKTKLVADNLNLVLNEDSLRRIKEQIEHWKDRVEPIKIRVDLDLSDPDVRRVGARLAILSRRRNAPIRPTLDRAAYAKVGAALAALAGGRALQNTLRGLSEAFRNMDKHVPIIGTLALAVAGLASWGATAASNLFSLSSSLASIGPAALLLPGLLGGIAVGVGVMVAAFKDFNTVFPDVKKKLSQLQDVISSSFWAKAKAPIRELIDETLPLFQAGMKKTATQLGSFFGNLATDLRTHLAPALKQMFDDLADSIDRFSEHTGSIAKIITVMGRIGSSRLPQMADWFGKLTDRFSDFLSIAEKDGRLKTWIDESIVAIKDLGSATGDLFGIFAGLGRAAKAAGGSTLGTLADTLERLHKAVDSFGFQSGLTQFLKAAHKGIDNLTDAAGPGLKNFMKALSDASTVILPQTGLVIGEVLNGIGNALSQPSVTRGLFALFDGLQVGFEAILPALPHVADALGAVGKILGELAGIIGPVFNVVFSTLADLLTNLTPHLTPLIKLLGGAWLEAWKSLSRVIERITPHLGDFIDKLTIGLGNAMPGVLAFFDQLANTLGDVLITVLDQVGDKLPALGTALGDLFFSLKDALPVIGGALIAVAPLLPAFVQAFIDLVPTIKELVPQLIDLGKEFLPVLTDLTKSLVEALPKITAFINGLAEPFAAVALAFTAIFSVFGKPLITLVGDVLNQILDDFMFLVHRIEDLWSLMVAVVKLDWGKGLKDIGNAINDFVLGSGAFFAGIGGVITNAIGDLSGLLVDVGKSVIGGLAKGIWSAATGVLTDTLHKVTDLIPLHKGPISTDRVLLYDAGQAIIGGLVNGLESQYDVVKKSLRGLTDDIGDTAISSPLAQIEAARGSRGVATAVDASITGATVVNKTLNYIAAPGSSLGAEEDLFAAADRGRFDF